MSAVLAEHGICTLTSPTPMVNDHLIRQQVSLILQMHPRVPIHLDRRCDRREPYPYPIRVTPLNANSLPEIDDTIVVVGKHLSERGLDFYYRAPVPYRRVITSWEYGNGRWLGLLLDLRWCRSSGHGWYENGGRFLKAVVSPFDESGELANFRPGTVPA